MMVTAFSFSLFLLSHSTTLYHQKLWGAPLHPLQHNYLLAYLLLAAAAAASSSVPGVADTFFFQNLSGVRVFVNETAKKLELRRRRRRRTTT